MAFASNQEHYTFNFKLENNVYIRRLQVAQLNTDATEE